MARWSELADPAVSRAAAAAFLIVVGILGVVTFIFVALVSRSWLFGLKGIGVSLLIACAGAALLNARTIAQLASVVGLEVKRDVAKRR